MPHRFTYRVRFRECDPMGIVFHTHYLDWFEYARTEALRELGLPYIVIQDSGTTLPVVDLAVKYHESARYDDLIIIETRPLLSESKLRLTCSYRILRQADLRLLVTGHVTLCFIENGRTRPVPAPILLQQALGAGNA
ncbi:MAG: thioesterase family protein [Bacteroidetes bacterium]|nr:thioesterase family protein [Bacteroidota bacterium]